MTEAHSKFSASSSHRWMSCPGSVALESATGIARHDSTSVYASEGTAAHELAALALTEGKPAAAYIGEVIVVDGREFEVDADMAGHVQTYIDTVQTYGGELMVEQRVHYHDWLGCKKEEAFGTSDAVIVDGDLLTVVDLKFGMGVRVFAERNSQLMLYALGALYEFEMLGDFKRVRMVISQPRIGHHDEWECDVAELHAFALEARAAVVVVQKTFEQVHQRENLVPSEDACRFCRAKATCPALAAEVIATVKHSEASTPADFDDLTVRDATLTGEYHADGLAKAMAKVDLIEDWCKAVRAEVERRLFAGAEVPGFKLVEGKRGNRAWSSAEAAVEAMKSMRLKHEDMYSYSLKGPAPMEKLLKKESPRRWATLQALIVQPEGRPHVAPASDGRPALSITPTADDFDDVSEAASAHPFRD